MLYLTDRWVSPYPVIACCNARFKLFQCSHPHVTGKVSVYLVNEVNEVLEPQDSLLSGDLHSELTNNTVEIKVKVQCFYVIKFQVHDFLLASFTVDVQNSIWRKWRQNGTNNLFIIICDKIKSQGGIQKTLRNFDIFELKKQLKFWIHLRATL